VKASAAARRRGRKNWPKYYSGINQVEVIVDGNEAGKKNVEVIARGEHGNIFVPRKWVTMPISVSIWRCTRLSTSCTRRRRRNATISMWADAGLPSEACSPGGQGACIPE